MTDKAKALIPKRLIIELFNSFTGEEYLSINAPYNRLKAVYGWYSKWVAKNKQISAEIYRCDKRFIKTKLITIR